MSDENRPFICKCPDNNELARTVTKVNDDFFKCPRCGGLIIAKSNTHPSPKPLNVEWRALEIEKIILANEFKGGISLSNEKYIIIYPSQVAFAIAQSEGEMER